jgi:opacity protein-like surface antigen
MKTLFKMLFCIGFFAIPTLAQGPPVAAKGPTVDASIGYSYVSMPIADSRVNLNGADANIDVDFSQFLGVRLDAGYVRATNVFDTGHVADILSYLGGPVVYPYRRKRWTAYGDLLLGAARVTGPIPAAGDTLLIRGFTNKFAWQLGGGVQFNLSRSWALRGEANYFRTSYFTPSTTIAGQNNIRIITSIVYSFRTRRP